jgi:hypothetical protein
MIFRREIQIPTEIIFEAMNLKNFKDDYGGKFAKFLEKVQSEFHILTFHWQTIWLYFSFSTLTNHL